MTVVSGDLGAALFRDEYIQDPYPLYAQMRDQGSVQRVGESDFYAVCSWDAVSEAVARTGDFSSNLTGTMTYQPGGAVGLFPMDELGGPTQVLAIADDPVHAAHRKLLVPHLAAKRIRALESFVTDTVADLVRDALQAGHVEWMSAVANRLPMMVVCRLIGVPDEDAEQLAAWGYASTQLLEGLVGPEQLAAAGTAAMELAAYVAARFDREAAQPHDTLMGGLARACAAGELDALTAQMMMVTLFSAGGESTASLIGSATQIVAARPDLAHRLRGNPGLIPAFLEEVLRFEPPFRGHYRHVLGDCTLDGHRLTAGSRLILLWGAANRDPAHIEAPDEFRMDRELKGHIAFGKGVHFCVGAALARLEARVVLEHLLAHTTHIHTAGPGRWLPSLLVRRLDSLTLTLEQ
ncbi:cytochrome P450 [Mycolicibacterium chubuense NBB4]|uniref:Cytochrome P450 n=1 Tax=Mycolicibacterium chubuense (strain NBB4) TaxID=710421 RepID=I4BL89_MYCCN|nr:cytochrome P450 [Mycolicibacterium chubuense]AFM18046.1 cytochrome P450 [Mycolicibacterium chubuense NBB4]